MALVGRLVLTDDFVEDEDPGVHIDINSDPAVRDEHLIDQAVKRGEFRDDGVQIAL